MTKKVKIKEIKKKVKITELGKKDKKNKEESLDEVVDMEDNFPIISSSFSSQGTNPTLAQHLDDIPLTSGTNQRKINNDSASTNAEKETSTAVNYATSRSTIQRSYDSSIRAEQQINSERPSAIQGVNPTLSQAAGGMIEQVNTNRFALDRRDSSSLERDSSPLRNAQANVDREYQDDMDRKYKERSRRMM